MKSNRLLRSYRKKPPTRVQHCSRCYRVGHNALSKLCSSGLTQQGDQGEGAHGKAAHGEFAHGEGIGDALAVEAALDESREEYIDDLLNDSDNELY